MPFGPKCQMPVDGQSIMISLGFRWGFSILLGLVVWPVFICAEEMTN
jgi:hypothetical protein